LPVVSRYVPATQFKHVVLDGEPVSGEYLPLPHKIQSPDSSLPVVSRYVPATQFVQAAFPVAGLYVPAKQVAQGPHTRITVTPVTSRLAPVDTLTMSVTMFPTPAAYVCIAPQ